MKPLFVLIAVFGISLLVNKAFRGGYDVAFSGRIAMSVMLVFTALGHFVYTKGMQMMLPSFVPFKTEAVFLTGIIEVVAAIGLFLPTFRVVTGWLLIVFFVLILPANIYAAINQIDYQKGTLGGHGVAYLWFRVPLQIVFIAWTYLAAIRS